MCKMNKVDIQEAGKRVSYTHVKYAVTVSA